MHIEHADKPLVFEDTIGGVTPISAPPVSTPTVSQGRNISQPAFIPTNSEIRSLSFNNPTSPIQYLQNNQPVLIQTPQGSSIVPMEVNNTPQPQPLIIGANLPQDQAAYKSGSEPMLSVSSGNPFSNILAIARNNIAKAAADKNTSENVLSAAPVIGSNMTMLIVGAVAIGIIIYLFRR